jgi:hypothetical protein
MTLKQFWLNPILKSSDVTEPGFRRLYVRKGKRFLPINGEYRWIDNLLTIANLVAEQEQVGTFTRLLAWVDQNLKCNVLVENIHNPGFAAALERDQRFIAVDINQGGNPPCFLKMVY